MNKVILSGHLGEDPVPRYMPSGQPLATASMATNERWRDKDSGETKESTEWHPLVIFGKPSENFTKICQKGSLVQIEGRLRTRTYTDKQKVTRRRTEIIVDGWELLANGRPNSGAQAPNPPSTTPPADMDGDYPF